MSDPKPSVPEPLINNPKIFPDPDKVRFRQLFKYTSLDMVKMAQSARNYRGSLLYIGGVLGSMAIYSFIIDGAANLHIYGENGNGGKFMNMYTRNNTYDYYYNREFQRMRYLSEEVTGNDQANQTSDEVLHDMGINVPQQGLNRGIVKKSPHYKYFY